MRRPSAHRPSSSASSDNTLVRATVSYDAFTQLAILRPTTPLAASAVYRLTVRGGATDPRCQGSSQGIALAGDFSWSLHDHGDAASTARARAGRSDPRRDEPTEPVQHVTTRKSCALRD